MPSSGTVILATFLAVSCAASMTFAALVPPGAPHAAHRDVMHEMESPLTEGDLLCNLCEEHLSPAVVRAIQASEAHHDSVQTMEDMLQAVISDTESHVHQPLFHEHLQHLLWDQRSVISIAALQRVHHKYPHRAHLMERLVDHVVCSCRSHAWATDRVFERMLERFVKEEFVELRKAGLIGRVATRHEERPAVDTTFSLFDAQDGADRPTPKNTRSTAYAAAAGMPEFAGIGTGDEVQGAEL